MATYLIKLFFAFVISFLVTFYLARIFYSFACYLQFVDIPDGKIKKHKQSTPYLGGLAVYCGFLFSLALTFPFENQMFLFFVGATLLLIVGLIDDLIVLKHYQKFFGQIIAALCFLKAGFYLKEQFFYNFWNIPISLMWILSIINAFNLVDVMDGLATLLAIIATISFLLISFLLKNYLLAMLLMAFLGSLVAFFWYNSPTAQIYLGDAGALFIGGILATVPFLLPWGVYNVHGYITPIIILAIPLIEISSLIIIRTMKGIPFYYASPDHFSIYLQHKGWGAWDILFFVAGFSLVLSCLSLLFVLNILSIYYLAGISFLLGIFWILILCNK